MSDFLQPYGPQHARPPCPSPPPRVYPNSCPLSQWCHPAISSSVFPFSSCPQSFPASGSFQMSQLFAWGGQSIGVSASVPSSEHSGLISFRMDWLDLLAVQGTLKSLLQHHSSKASILQCSAFFIVQLSHPYMTTGKTIALTKQTFPQTKRFFSWINSQGPVPSHLLSSAEGTSFLLVLWFKHHLWFLSSHSSVASRRVLQILFPAYVHPVCSIS